MRRSNTRRMLKIFIQGKPIPQGSLNPMPYRKKNGKMGVNVFQKPALIEWREKIAQEVRAAKGELFFPKETPVYLVLSFYLVRPKSTKRRLPCCKGIDIDKACRSVLDALSGVLYNDDCQVCYLLTRKMYVESEKLQGLEIEIPGEYPNAPVNKFEESE